MAPKPIDRLMFAQGNHCFFCNMPLPREEASVEHLVPSARAGSNSDDNCVVCCKTMNALLGSMSLKEKIKVVLNQKGQFKCPKGAQTVAAPTPATSKPLPQSKPVLQSTPATPSQPATPAKPVVSSKPSVAPKPKTSATASVSGAAPASSNAMGDSSTHRISPETISLVLDNLRTRGNARPRHLSSLRATLKATASFKLSDTQIDILIQHLRTSGKIAVTNEMVAYRL